MTLQKHNSIYDYVLIGSAILFTLPIGNFSAGNITYYSNQVSHKDTTLPYHPVFTNDSVQQSIAFEKLVKPEIRINDAAVKFTKKFIKKNEKDLLEIQQRSDKFFNIMESVFAKYNLPQQLKYLAVVESDLKADARSKVGAVGTWQLMRETAIELGLKVNGKNDERRSIAKSSVAAAKYLKSLYKYYGDWLLVIAAYNSGPGFVNTAIKKSGSKNFWKLQSFLPAETRGHVKRYVAMHYFFEGVGSETTLTKAENISYLNELEQYNDRSEQLSLSADTNTTQIKNIASTNNVSDKK
jgi:membrane-bound lytic murein transglycosylase D